MSSLNEKQSTVVGKNIATTHTAKVIAIANQKGGVGKTTMTTLVANILHFMGGVKKGYKVAILDLDSPQFSTYKRRQKMEQIYQAHPQKAKVLALLKSKYPDDLLVYPATLQEAPALIETLKKSAYDFIFLDMPGTLNTGKNTLGYIYAYVNHFFIPTYQCGDTLRSSLEFYSQIDEVIADLDSSHLRSCHLFFNRIPHKNELAKYRSILEKANAPLMDSIVHQYRVFENTFRNTLMPIPLDNKGTENKARNLLLFVQEFLQIVENPNFHQYAIRRLANRNNEAKKKEVLEIPVPNTSTRMDSSKDNLIATPS